MNEEPAGSDSNRGSDPSRVLALSDGVFAIIITLLVLEIQVPDLENGTTLGEALREVRPSFVAFLISFLLVAIAWAGHHDLFAMVRRVDPTLIWLNILYLLPLAILPFGASLLARYDRDPIALGWYGSLLVAITVTRLAAWLYATSRTQLLFQPLDAWSRRVGTAMIAGPGLAYAIAVAIANFAPTVALLLYALVPASYFLTVAIVRRMAPPGAAERDFT